MWFYWILYEYVKNVFNRSNWYLFWVCFLIGIILLVFIEFKYKIVREGKGLLLFCVIIGKFKFCIRWKKNGKMIMLDNRIRIRVIEIGFKLWIRNVII